MELPQKVGLGGFLTVLIGIAFGWVIFPFVLTGQIGKMKGLVPGSESRQFWEKIPFSLDLKVYVFNVTNYKAVHESGETPVLDEIGPYVFDEWKEKVDIVDYEQDDSVSFHMKNLFLLNKEKSAPLTGRETVVIPHLLLMGVVMSSERNKPSALGLINTAIPIMFSNPESVFFIGPAMQYLFEGLTLNCTGKDFYSVAVCSVLKREVKDLVPTETKNFFRYSVFGSKNNTPDPNVLRVHRGISNPLQVGEMISVNGKPKLNTWRGRPCNDILGTDSTVFPPSIKPEMNVWTYSGDICRSLPGVFTKKSKYKRIETLRFGVSLGDMSKDPTHKCFCYNETTCLKKGAMDMMPCLGAPIVATMPHFYDSDADYLKGVRGLRPEKDKHETIFELEPYTGTPVYAKKRIMLSMPMHKVKQINLTENLPDAIVPLLWLEESLELNDQFIEKIDSELFRIIRIVDISKWLMLTLGSIVMIAGVGLYYKKKNALAVTPTSTASRRTDTPDHYLDNKGKTRGLELDMGHTNYGYM